MSTWNKVLVGLIIVTSLVYFYFGALALKTHQAWQECYEGHEAALEKIAQQENELINGPEGLRALKVEVNKFTVDRGRVWPGAKPLQFNPATGEASVVVTLPPPPPSAVNLQLFAFEEPTQGKPHGDYLGEFTLKAVGGQLNQQWQLQPARALADDQKARIQQSRGTWSLCELMPRAVPGYFELAEGGQPRAEAAPAAPPAKVEQSAPSGTAPAAEPSPRDTAKPKLEYLADYEGLFTEFYRLRAVLTDAIASEQTDLAAMENSLTQAQQRIDQLNKEVADLKVELAKAETARDTVAAHRQAVENKVAELQSAIAQTQKANQAAVAEIARIQLEATRRIDERTRTMAQAGAGK
jgi:cell division protein FtsL